MIGKLHRRGDGAMAGDIGDQLVHALTDAAVRRMALRSRAELDDVHRLARVHVHVEANAVRHDDRIRRDLSAPPRDQGVVQLRRGVHHGPPLRQRADLFDGRWLNVPVISAERLPVEGQ